MESTQQQFDDAVRLHRQGRYREAHDAYLKVLDDPRHRADVASNLSALSMQMGDVPSAERYARQAVAGTPRHANGWNHLGLALRAKGAMVEAGNAFRAATSHDPKHAQAFANLAEILVARDDIAGAITCYASALNIDPELSIALVGYIHRKQQIADWNGLDEALARMSRQIAQGEPAIDPFMLLFCCTEPAEIAKACQNAGLARDRSVDALWGTEPYAKRPRKKGRIRIGYVSANYYDHAVGTLICQLLEAHDRENFEIFCYCHSTVKSGHRRDRIKRAADHFIEIDGLNDRDAASRIHDDEIDILVDLMGYTKGQRLSIFSLRPAPVQVTWIGFAGSAGGRAADYIIADRVVIPEGFERFYSEKPVRMPVCYQVNDGTRDLAKEPLTRSMLGIPDDRLVFCNFNQIAKITPPVVDLWAEIMKRVPNSILWLWDLFPIGSRAMRAHLAARGIKPERIYFGGTLPEPEHLTRYSLCDLFLDSFPYCGHATASNALFGGVPLLTLPGRTFASRVSASLLTALGMTELIAASPGDYVNKAVTLAKNPEKLSALKTHLISARRTSPLFDGRRFAADIEKAYRLMLERHARGEAPAAIDL